MYLGDYIVIERQTGPFTFECCSVSTGTPFTAEVDPDKRHLFADRTWIDARPTACRFLRPDNDLVRCTIHRDSPPQCKFYRCRVMWIFNRSGQQVGTITGTLALHSDDPDLREVYDEAMRSIPDTDPGAEELLQEYFERLGYRIE
jgi:Fe-S-cluster containining protein